MDSAISQQKVQIVHPIENIYNDYLNGNIYFTNGNINMSDNSNINMISQPRSLSSGSRVKRILTSKYRNNHHYTPSKAGKEEEESSKVVEEEISSSEGKDTIKLSPEDPPNGYTSFSQSNKNEKKNSGTVRESIVDSNMSTNNKSLSNEPLEVKASASVPPSNVATTQASSNNSSRMFSLWPFKGTSQQSSPLVMYSYQLSVRLNNKYFLHRRIDLFLNLMENRKIKVVKALLDGIVYLYRIMVVVEIGIAKRAILSTRLYYQIINHQILAIICKGYSVYLISIVVFRNNL